MPKALVATVLLVSCASAVAAAGQDRTRTVVDAVIPPLMHRDHIPGMAVGVVAAGKTRVIDYGVASLETGNPVTDATLFELGSITKTFTATLVAYAAREGRLSLSDPAAKYLPVLTGKAFGAVTLLALGTHTPGGLPLQLPEKIRTEAQLMQYLAAWRPSCPPGSCRTYSNVGIGTLGLIAAKTMNGDFPVLMEKRLLPALGLTSTYITVPDAEMPRYAEGYTKDNVPVRMSMGVLSPESAGLKSTVTDMLRYLQVNMNMAKTDGAYSFAVLNTHTGWFRDGAMTQDLMWEQYAWPVSLATLLEGNSSRMLLQPTAVTAIEPPEQPRRDVWINKTGSTNGFGAYVAFVPEKRLGIVMLANRNYPIPDRVAAAYRVLSALGPRD